MIGSLVEDQNGGPDALCRVAYLELNCPEGHQRKRLNWDFPDMDIVDLCFWAADDVQVIMEEREDG